LETQGIPELGRNDTKGTMRDGGRRLERLLFPGTTQRKGGELISQKKNSLRITSGKKLRAAPVNDRGVSLGRGLSRAVRMPKKPSLLFSAGKSRQKKKLAGHRDKAGQGKRKRTFLDRGRKGKGKRPERFPVHPQAGLRLYYYEVKKERG